MTLGRYCGNRLPVNLVSSGSKLFIAFHTDGSVQRRGFVLNYTTTFSELNGLCDVYVGDVITAKSGSLVSSKGKDCTKIILAPSGWRIKFTIYHVRDYNASISVHDGGTTVGTKKYEIGIGQVVGKGGPLVFYTSSNALLVHTNTRSFANSSKFYAEFEMFSQPGEKCLCPPTVNSRTICSFPAIDNTSTFYFNNDSPNVYNKKRCTTSCNEGYDFVKRFSLGIPNVDRTCHLDPDEHSNWISNPPFFDQYFIDQNLITCNKRIPATQLAASYAFEYPNSTCQYLNLSFIENEVYRFLVNTSFNFSYVGECYKHVIGNCTVKPVDAWCDYYNQVVLKIKDNVISDKNSTKTRKIFKLLFDDFQVHFKGMIQRIVEKKLIVNNSTNFHVWRYREVHIWCPTNFVNGRLHNWETSKSCISCPVHYYKNRNYFPYIYEHCRQCPPFKRRLLNESTCVNGSQAYPKPSNANCQHTCPLGKYFDNISGICVWCDYGQFQNSTTVLNPVCQSCPAGKTTTFVGAQSETDCMVKCLKGQFAKFPSCFNCDNGYYMPYEGNQFNKCFQCPLGKTTLKTGAANLTDCVHDILLYCHQGEYFDFNFHRCTQCPLNTFNDQKNHTAYICKQCPQNKKTRNEGSTNVSQCICSRGEFLNVTNQACEKCPNNTYQDSMGQNSCKSCARNTFTLKPGSKTCIKRCHFGTFFNKSAEMCQDCLVGYFQNITNHTLSRCLPCPQDYYANKIASKTCTQCPNKRITASNASSDVSECLRRCEPGFYLNVTLGSCVGCPKGFYQGRKEYRYHFCTKCPSANMTTLVSGATSIGQCVEYCASSPCYNGAECTNIDNDFICTCPLYLSGKQCQTILDKNNTDLMVISIKFSSLNWNSNLSNPNTRDFIELEKQIGNYVVDIFRNDSTFRTVKIKRFMPGSVVAFLEINYVAGVVFNNPLDTLAIAVVDGKFGELTVDPFSLNLRNYTCGTSLGMENGRIPDGAITSGVKHNYHPLTNARLNHRGPGWAPQPGRLEDAYLQVDFGLIVELTGIATQGSSYGGGRWLPGSWLQAYQLNYSTNGSVWQRYKARTNVAVVFIANVDVNTTVRNDLEYPVRTRYVRILLFTVFNAISYRCEFYGCPIPKYGVSPTVVPRSTDVLKPSSVLGPTISTAHRPTHLKSSYITPTPSKASSSIATPSTSMTPVPVYLNVTPVNPKVVENSIVIFSCDCGGCNLRPFWLKDSLPIHFNQSETPYSLLPNGSLVINASRHTAGNYSCGIKTSFRGWMYRSVELDVWYLNAFHVTGDKNPYRGENISLSCQGDGNPYPSFTWYFNDQPLEQNSRILLEKSKLNIFNATMNDNGEYTCVANNSAGSVRRTLVVAVKDIPLVKISTNLPKYILVDKYILFACHSENWNFTHRLWKIELVKDGIPIITKLPFPARESDTGKYQCKATIGAASRFSTPFFLIVGTPSRPVVLKGDPETSATGIRLSWHPISKTFWNGEEVSFEVNVFSVSRILQKSHTTKTTSAIISGLRPDTTYIIHITGITVFGRFQNSTVTSVNTKENKNIIKYQLHVRLRDYEFSNKLLDETSSQYKKLKSKMEKSLKDIFGRSKIRFWFIVSTVSNFKKGSVVVVIVVSLSSQFKEDPSELVSELNKADAIAEYKFDKSYTRQEDFDECANSGSNTCHEYAHCENVPGTYICNCFEGFFGDGEKCQGPPQIRSKSSNITQFVETNVTLVCTVFANPDPTISWKRADRDGKFTEIKKTRNKYDGNYSISNAGLEDSGTYLCYASNELGHDSYTTTVIIKPVIVDIDVEIKLSNKTFKEELKNKSSPAYKELEEDVYDELYNFFNNTPGFEDIEILGFVNGSIKVIFRVIVKVLKPSKESNDVVAVKIGRKINKQLKTGRIGNIQVVPDAIKLKVPPPPPANVTSSDVKETRVHIYWEPPELHEMFSIEKYYITYLKYGSKIWSNNTINAEQLTNTQLDNLESDTFYIIIIIAENAYGLGKESSRIEIKTKKVEVVSPWYYVGPIIAVACVVLLVAIIFVVRRVLHSHAWKPVDEKFDLGKKPFFQMQERKNQNENTYTNVFASNAQSNSTSAEILRTRIEISNEILIPGAFGFHVVRGTFLGHLEKERKTCSVKMLKENANENDHRYLMNELATMSEIEDHENVVNLIGACTSEDGPLLLVLEFCSRGTLETNLRDNEKIEQLFLKKTKINLANEIANGMAHLTSEGIVHQDLAAKNVLLTDDFTPKIANFGLPRDLYDSYHKTTQTNSSIRWLAIESLTDGLYTTKSDVWSFAVLMWEIETNGCVPYRELDVENLVNQIHGGYRLSKPEETSNEMYKLMLQCWETNPEDRPTFHVIIDILEEHIKNNESFVDVPLSIST
ncbi:uncharacterized protein LOC114518358 [Dendronephthya gigantea]|uniref:uncharacterized protein LOC114518358 n=1 Tax=Dendronephthya gigantea TaxID=151771 RepID=UPI00106BAA93|nr:uncharacterized protein LOC114518358 [Dendronephthya gigantea]